MSQASGDQLQTLGSIVGGLAGDVQDLVRGEIALAKSEFEQKLNRILAAAVSLLGGALLAFAGIVVLLLGVAQVLGLAIAFWLALFIVGGIALIAGVVLAKGGVAQLTDTNPMPDRTAKNLQKDAHMLKEHT